MTDLEGVAMESKGSPEFLDLDGTKDSNHPILSDAYPSTLGGGRILYTLVLASGAWMFILKLQSFILKSNHRSNNTSMITGNQMGTSTIFHLFNSTPCLCAHLMPYIP